VSDVNEIIGKITSQESTTESLKNLTRENQKKVYYFYNFLMSFVDWID